MTNDAEQSPLPKAEVLRRLVGLSREHDEEDVEFWRAASDEVRGMTLYRLLARGKAIRAAAPALIEDDAERLILYPGRIVIQRRDE
ncbi:MAG: hypothetical protein ACYDCQ_12325 [Dehalococcoidia bacterium]